MTTLILADSEINDLESLIANLRKKRPDWLVSNMSSGQQVLEYLASNDVDCIVSDTTLDDMSGSDLLEKVQEDNADLIRFMKACNTGDDAAKKNAQLTHNLIYQSMSADELISAVETSLRLRDLLGSAELKNTMSQVSGLPSLPDVYQRMMEELGSPQSSLMNVARIMETDVGLTATVLKIINSAFYGLNQQVESVSQGVALLGASLIKNVTLTAKVFSQFEGNQPDLKRLRLLNDQANKTGALANHFARLARVPKTVVDHTQIAGMLGNCGQLLAMNTNSGAGGIPQFQDQSSIREELMGAYLLKMWLMPDPIVEAVALQHEEQLPTNTAVSPMLILHAIRYLERHLPDVSDDLKWQSSLKYVGQIVGADLAMQWLDAYSDLQLLTSHNDLDDSQAA